jgi:hypothetical protein
MSGISRSLSTEGARGSNSGGVGCWIIMVPLHSGTHVQHWHACLSRVGYVKSGWARRESRRSMSRDVTGELD